jgi:hypothetical protein
MEIRSIEHGCFMLKMDAIITTIKRWREKEGERERQLCVCIYMIKEKMMMITMEKVIDQS